MYQSFTTDQPKVSTGWSFDGALKQPDFDLAGRPRLHGGTFVFPPGARFDLTDVPSCTASDDSIRLNGLGACPAGSQVGSGQASLLLGSLGITLPVNVYQFAAGSGFAVVLTYCGSVLGVVRATIDENRITSTSSPPGTWVTSFRLDTENAGTDKHPLIRTPPHCPKNDQ